MKIQNIKTKWRTRFFSVSLFALHVHKTTADWIDPDTPESVRTTKPLQAKYAQVYPMGGHSTRTASTIANETFASTETPSMSPYSTTSSEIPREYVLVMSDEFNVPYRNFSDGNDPKWTALNKNDYTNNALHFYSHDQVTTNENGELEILTEIGDTKVVGFDDVKMKNTHITKNFKSGMLQSWNKFCFTGGIIEAEVELPGWHDIGGLWPAFWILGNLARHTYVGSASHVWPFSSTTCTNHTGESQLINGCMDAVHFGMKPKVGRGAPEVDIFEVQPGNMKRNQGSFWQMPVGQPFMSTSYQVAPGRIKKRPGDGYWPAPDHWYHGLKYGSNTTLNILYYGSYNFFRDDVNPAKQDYWSDAISFNTQLNSSHFEGRHTYRLEWEVPDKETNELGYLRWFLDGTLIMDIDGEVLQNAGTGEKNETNLKFQLRSPACCNVTQIAALFVSFTRIRDHF